MTFKKISILFMENGVIKKFKKNFHRSFLTLVVFEHLTMGFYVRPFHGQILHNFRSVDT